MKGNKADEKSQAITLAVEKENRKPAAGSNPIGKGDRGKMDSRDTAFVLEFGGIDTRCLL